MFCECCGLYDYLTLFLRGGGRIDSFYSLSTLLSIAESGETVSLFAALLSSIVGVNTAIRSCCNCFSHGLIISS